MTKRKSYLPLPEDVPLKQLKKAAPRTIRCKFLFISQTPHTKFISCSNLRANDSRLYENNEVISIYLPQEDAEKIVIKYSLEEYKNILMNQISSKGKISFNNNDIMEEEKETKIINSDFKTKESIAVLLKEQEFTNKEICKYLNISKNKLRSIVRQTQMGEDVNVSKKAYSIKLTHEMSNALDNFLKKPENASATLNEMKQYICNNCHINSSEISVGSVRELLKSLGYTRKKVTKHYEKRNDLRTINSRFIVAQKFIQYLNDGFEFIFIDETSFNKNLSPLYGYAKKGSKCIIKTPPKGENYSLIAAMTANKMLAFQIFKGSVKANDFGAFISQLFTKITGLKINMKKCVLFLDNASIHRSRNLEPFLKKFNILYNAAYSPPLNPIEELFGSWKASFRKQIFHHFQSVIEKIISSYRTFEKKDISHYFKHSLSYLWNCLEKNPI